ncbi:MAG: hypothetical protein FRX49_05349 [Trebouxia sp. A1-2]|nr:MAG: hypothetical protein FRX49_05349 [Trebouxia sp. A1-2]
MPRFPGYGHANRFQPDFYGDNQAYHQFRDHPSFQSSLSRQPVSNRPLHHHLHESDPGYVDLRCVPAWDCSHLRSQSGSGTRQQEQLSGVCQLSDAGSPRRLRPLSRRIVIEDGDDFPVAGYARVPLAVAREARTAASMQQSHAQAASQRSHAESDDDQDDGDEAGDLDSEQQRLQQLQHRQQLQEHLLRQRRLQEEQERRLAQQKAQQQQLRSQRLRDERPLLEKLAQANSKLDVVASRLHEVTGCIRELQTPESSQPLPKLKHCHAEMASPEQLQKQLVELSELSMQVVLSMDDLHSEAKEVRSLRKRMVQKALALMENIDNAKSGMLRSVMDSHPTDDHSELSAAESDSERASNSSPEMDDIKPSTEEHVSGGEEQEKMEEQQGAEEKTRPEKGLAAGDGEQGPSS